MIDSETGLPYDWSNPGGGSASTQPALLPTPVQYQNQGGGGSASMQPALIPNAQPTPWGQGAGQGGGGMSPLLQYLMGGQGMAQGGGISPLMMLLMGLGGGGAASMQPAFGVTPQQPGIPSMGANGQILPQIAQLLQQQQGPPPDPLTAQQRAFMGYGGQGQPPNWAAAMGMDDPTGGWTPGYQPQQQANPWNALMGSAGGTTNDVGIVPGTRAFGQ